MGFCPRCGKETEHQFCTSCLRELHPLVTKIKEIRLTMCPICLRTQHRSSWTKRDMQQLFEKELERSTVFAQGARIDDALIEPLTLEPGVQEIQVTIVGSADPNAPAYEEHYVVPVHIQGNRCTECEKFASKTYHNGILQLRRPNEQVQHEAERLLSKALTQAKDVTGGIDYYVTDHRILQNVAHQLHSMFGGELSVNAQHFSYNHLTSKNVYRVNVCLRLPKYWKGSLIKTGNKLFLVTNMGKTLKGIDIMTGKTTSAPANNEYEEFPLEQTSVVTVHPSITVLDPQTYQTMPILNEREEFKALQPGDNVMIANLEEGIYIVEKAE